MTDPRREGLLAGLGRHERRRRRARRRRPEPDRVSHAARHVRAEDPRRQRGRPGGPRRRPRRRAPPGRLGRGRGRPGDGQLRRPRVLQPQGRPQRAPVRLVPRRAGPVGVPAPGRAPDRRPRPGRPLRAAGRPPALRRVDPAGRLRRPRRSASRRSRRSSPRRACSTRPASGRSRRGRRTIAVITSPTGVVWRDIGHVLARRWPLTQVVLVACQVQGEEAPASIVSAFRRLERWIEQCRADGRARDAPQVTILARGGGSLEDLWSFNDERVVRAVVAHALPVVCGVGHEVDVTLADFAADVRAPTPSAAAELVVPDRADWMSAFRRAGERTGAAAWRALDATRRELGEERRALDRLDPRAQLAADRERVGLLLDRAVRVADRRARDAARRPRRRRGRAAETAARPRRVGPCDAGGHERGAGRAPPAGDAGTRLRDRPASRRRTDPAVARRGPAPARSSP